MAPEFKFSTTLKKAGRVFLYGMTVSAGLAAEDMVMRGELNLKKAAISISLSGLAGGLEALRNWRKMGKEGRRRRKGV